MLKVVNNMCGICGIFGKNDPSLIKKMTKIMEHRGPDDEGYFLDDNISLGMRRLSIIDLKKGAQPIFNEDRNICVIFNGEIYNFKNLRYELRKRGHRFTTNSDTEVIVHAYEEFGSNFIHHLNGMFAFALWDGSKKRLTIARDRLGIKPLYYTFVDKDTFLFASEMKSLLQHEGVNKTIDEDALSAKKTFGFFINGMTLFKEIKQLLPGRFLTLSLGENSNINLTNKQYYTLRITPDDKLNENFLVDKIEYLLKLSVKEQLVADVPIGVILSGGLDSTLITTLANKLSDNHVKTFTFSDDEKNPDIKYSRMVAEELGIDHHEMIMPPQSIINELPKICFHLENMNLDFCYFYVSKLASQKKIKVFLCGEGSDELFGGYGYFLKPEDYDKFIKNSLMSEFFSSRPVLSNYILEAIKTRNKTPLDQVLTFHLKDQLCNNHLLLLDNASMAWGLECRVPYLNDSLVNFACNIPSKYKIRYQRLKYILRKTAKNVLNEKLRKVIWRRKVGAPNSFRHMRLVLQDFASKTIDDKQFKSHPLYPFFWGKIDMLFFDLFNEIFIKNNCKLPKKFNLSDIY